VLNTYRDILDSLASALLEKETLDRRDLEVIFAEVEKRPRITTFDEFGPRLPSDRPPIKTPGELAIERGEPWPPPESLPDGRDQQPVPVGAVSGYPGQSGYNTGPGYPSVAQPQAVTGGPGPSQVPPNWTGGVLPGPLAPLPGWQQPGPDAGAAGRGQRAGNGAHQAAPNGGHHAAPYTPYGSNGSNGSNGSGGPNHGGGGHAAGPYSAGPDLTKGRGGPPAPQYPPAQQYPPGEENGQPPADPWAPPPDARR
jgi:cell division protease FtsH